MIGPRNVVVREMLGEHVPLSEWLMDQSPFIDSDSLTRRDVLESYPEFWADQVHDYISPEQFD